MAEQKSSMTPRQIAALLVGILLLLPGLCGTFVFGANMFEHLSRLSFKFEDYEELVWIISQPSAVAGALGIFAIAKASGNPGWAKAARVAGWIALVITIISVAFVINAGRLRSSTAMSEGIMMGGIFIVAFLICALPGLLMKPPAPATDTTGAASEQ